MEQESEIAKWYGGQHVLVTGGTGFMGKIMVEKLLRSCPDISVLYLIVRSKRDKQPKQRLDELLSCPAFDLLRKSPEFEDIKRKLKIIPGDLSKDCLGLTKEDEQTLQNNVTTVFHMAANVKFDQPLKTAVLTNTGGTLRLLKLVSTFKQVKAFVHVSTSYCHCDQTRLEERIYKAPHSPRQILDLVSWMDDDLLDILAPKLMKNAPNAYSYTKCLTEELVAEYASAIPVVIARPSIVVAVWKEPVPGWIANLNGPTGLLVGAGKGVIRTMHCNADLIADVVPVDTTINCLIALAWKLGTSPRKSEPSVYHLVCNKKYPISWREALDIGKKHFYANPFSVCLWYPRGGPISNYFLHLIAAFFLHTVPAYFIDFMLVLTRNKPFLVRTQKRINSGLKVLQYYTTRSWDFCNENTVNLYKELNPTDRRLFYDNTDFYDYESFMLQYILGARRYCVREDPETLPLARKSLKRMYYLDIFAHILLFCLIIWLFVSFTKLSFWN